MYKGYRGTMEKYLRRAKNEFYKYFKNLLGHSHLTSDKKK
jgi:hypothetical protein